MTLFICIIALVGIGSIMLPTKIYFCVFISYICVSFSFSLIYDSYTGLPATEEQLRYYDHIHQTGLCTIDVTPCDARERRRIDGTCNNLNHPARGTHFSPLIRLLPALYYNGSYPRKSIYGKELTLPRVIRTYLLSEGKSSSLDFSQAMCSYGIFMFSDIGSGHDIIYFLRTVTHCCQEEGKNDYMCTPNIIPEDDPVHRLSGIRCMNMTRPLAQQNFGCTDDAVPSPVGYATKVFDLSHIYNFENLGDKVIRSYAKGKLTIHIEDGKTWPPSGPSYCPFNQRNEKMCFKNYPNSILPVNILVVWFVRYHNYLASQLAFVNPCWDDETLFQVARDINIAVSLQIYLYEWLAQLIGRENLIKAGVISSHMGFRDVYDNRMYPAVTLEYAYILQWFHTVQEGTAKMYKADGTFLEDYPMMELTLRPGFLSKHNNIVYLTQGQFRQPAADIDYGVDYDMAENGLGGLQKSFDSLTSDLHKGRLYGLRPYIDYVFYCTGIKITNFEQLSLFMDTKRIEQLKKVYKHVEDIDLMAGAWCEKPMPGGKISPIVACILNDNIVKMIKGDRHWYERPDRPHAFNFGQLLEIRKSSLAMLLCSVGDQVTKVQRHAFRTITAENPILDCSQIPQIDFSAWADPKCRRNCH